MLIRRPLDSDNYFDLLPGKERLVIVINPYDERGQGLFPTLQQPVRFRTTL